MKTNEYLAANEDDSRDGLLGRRRVLGDVTNSLGKRTLSRSPGGSVLENENARGKLEDDEFGRQVCKGVEKLVREKENASLGLVGSENVPFGDGKKVAFFKAKRPCRSKNLDEGGDESAEENEALDVSQIPLGAGELQRSLNCDSHLLRVDTVIRGITEGDGFRDGCVPSACLARGSGKARDSSPILEGDFQDDYGKIIADVIRSPPVVGDVEMSVMCTHEKSDKGKNVVSHSQIFTSNACNFQIVDSQESKTDGGEALNQASLDKSSPAACSEEPSSLGSKSFGFVGSAKVHDSCSGDDGLNPNEHSDKTCSCPFCVKAAYLWSDLHYQDARDRLAALKKSRRQVRQLVTTYSYIGVGEIAHDDSDKSAKMEIDLMHQWRSLFLHTEDVLVRESNQLQSDLIKLKDLREDCMRDLRMMKGESSGLS